MSFRQALEKNAVAPRLGDVALKYETTVLVGRADKPPRGLYAGLALVAGFGCGAAALAAILTREDTTVIAAFVGPAVAGFVAAAWLEQRERRQRAFAVDFVQHLLRLDFSTPLSGMPRTLKIPFEQVRDVELSMIGGRQVLTVDFEQNAGLYREVLIAAIAPEQAADAERVRRIVRAAVGLEHPPAEVGPSKSAEPLPPVDSFG